MPQINSKHTQGGGGGAQKKKISMCHHKYKRVLRFVKVARFLSIKHVFKYSAILLILNTRRITLRPRIANQVGEDNYCRGGSGNTRRSRSRALFVRPESRKALWRFRASTSNSLSGLMWPHTHTAFRYSYHKLTLNEIFECVEMTICSRPIGGKKIPRRFDFFAQVFEYLDMTF